MGTQNNGIEYYFLTNQQFTTLMGMLNADLQAQLLSIAIPASDGTEPDYYILCDNLDDMGIALPTVYPIYSFTESQAPGVLWP